MSGDFQTPTRGEINHERLFRLELERRGVDAAPHTALASIPCAIRSRSSRSCLTSSWCRTWSLRYRRVFKRSGNRFASRKHDQTNTLSVFKRRANEFAQGHDQTIEQAVS